LKPSIYSLDMHADTTPAGKERRRLDIAVTEAGLAESRARAQALILGGGIRVAGTVMTRPGTLVAGTDRIELVSQPLPYVSRGGLKMRHALDTFEIDPRGLVAADVGASTGGFSDALLQRGAARIYAIDVGYGQFAWKLRNDPRVVVMERTNIRSVESLPEAVDLAVVDVSFISLELVLPPVQRLLRPSGHCVALIKPQFEAGRRQVGKKGVVRDPGLWSEVIRRVARHAGSSGWTVTGLTRSPITGPAGNVEFLLHLQFTSAQAAFALDDAIGAVAGTG